MDLARPDSPPFARVGRREVGYNTRQVDRFLTRARSSYDGEGPATDAITSGDVRSMAFDPARGGYEPQAVDAALDRLEDVLAQRERDHLIRTEGEDAWLRQIGRTAAVLRRRLHRPAGERFRRPSKPGTPSYSVEDVDRLCDDLLQYLENHVPMSVDVVRRAVFREAQGADGYEEAQVDAFLDRVIELMAGID
ncbi:DivIVA domain-containing protein [Arthrobacter antioxidans]|uniref:DivIVA domain-containing protein n=1 Tax=Arthrobacter antioxidans TaxID=2895818 RepID=UPI001FFF0C8A|nr:DivIVA domain-containing protein [Arthrobacter antioxidans]